MVSQSFSTPVLMCGHSVVNFLYLCSEFTFIGWVVCADTVDNAASAHLAPAMTVSPLLPLIGLAQPLAAGAIRGASQLVSNAVSFTDFLNDSAGSENTLESSHKQPTELLDLLNRNGDALTREERTIIEKGLEQFERLFAKHRLEGNAFSPIELSVRDGKLVLPEDHPDREAIEKLLSSDPQLRETLTRLTQLVSEVASKLTGSVSSDSIADQLAAGKAQGPIQSGNSKPTIGLSPQGLLVS